MTTYSMTTRAKVSQITAQAEDLGKNLSILRFHSDGIDQCMRVPLSVAVATAIAFNEAMKAAQVSAEPEKVSAKRWYASTGHAGGSLLLT